MVSQEQGFKKLEKAWGKLKKLAANDSDEEAKLRLARRLHEAKMERFSIAVDRKKGNPTLQLERYYKAKLELKEAEYQHPRHTQSQSGTVTVVQSRAWVEGLGLQSAAGGWDCCGTGVAVPCRGAGTVHDRGLQS